MNLTFCVWPGLSVTRLNPSSRRTGCNTLVSLSCRYSCATSSPATEPVLVTSAVTVSDPLRGTWVLDSFRLATENVVYDRPYPNGY